MADADENHNNEDGDAAQEQEINDNDSALGSEPPSSTQSLSSTICNYTYENGRRYHAYRAGNYFMPNDEQEQDYMDLWHHISTMILEGELFRAPVVNPQNILDIGTGTGIWAIDVADMFPNTHVIATDLSPIQPTWVPPNVQFQIDDCESEWNFNHSFDFVHIRNMSGSIADWPKLFSQAFAHLKPGGWLEASNIEAWGQSYNSSIPRDSASVEWQEKLRGAATTVGRELNIGPDLYRLVSSAGFVDVKDDIHKIPMSLWMKDPKKKELARYFYDLACSELEGLSLALYTRVLGWEPERLHALLDAVRQEIKNPEYQMYSDMHYVCGRKPVD